MNDDVRLFACRQAILEFILILSLDLPSLSDRYLREGLRDLMIMFWCQRQTRARKERRERTVREGQRRNSGHGLVIDSRPNIGLFSSSALWKEFYRHGMNDQTNQTSWSSAGVLTVSIKKTPTGVVIMVHRWCRFPGPLNALCLNSASSPSLPLSLSL